MDGNCPVELDSLTREWIVGEEGTCFAARVIEWIERLEQTPSGPLLLATAKPVEFTVAFMAALLTQRPLVLGNPCWGELEWAAVASQIKPAIIVGEVAIEISKEVNSLPAGAILIPTGGSTGGVRFAFHDWQSLSAAVSGWSLFLGDGVERLVCLLPLYHVSGLMQLVRSFHLGIALEFVEDVESEAFKKSLSSGAVVSLVATQLERILKKPALLAVLKGTKAIFVGGGPLRKETAEAARNSNLPLVLSYGMTETAAMVTALPIQEFLDGAFNAGRPLGETKLTILDAKNHACKIGEVGRIQIESPSLFHGYHKNKFLTPKAGTYLSDDEGFLDAKGCLHILGRRDQLINSGGEKIDPRQIETVLLEAKLVTAALVVGQPDPDWVEQVVLFYVSPEELNIKELLSGRLSGHKVPKLSIRVPELPLNLQGKTDWVEVRRLVQAYL
jgi:O-succinylbenzoic acid--CoA ligase